MDCLVAVSGTVPATVLRSVSFAAARDCSFDTSKQTPTNKHQQTNTTYIAPINH